MVEIPSLWGQKAPKEVMATLWCEVKGSVVFWSCFRAQRRFAVEEGYTCGIDLCHPGCPPQDNSTRPHLSFLQEATVTIRPLCHCHRWAAPEWTEWTVRDIGDHITRIFQGLLQSPPYGRVKLHCTYWLCGTWDIGSKQMAVFLSIWLRKHFPGWYHSSCLLFKPWEIQRCFGVTVLKNIKFGGSSYSQDTWIHGFSVSSSHVCNPDICYDFRYDSPQSILCIGCPTPFLRLL